MGETILKQIKVRYTCEFDVLIGTDEDLTDSKLKRLSKEIQGGAISSTLPFYDVTKSDNVKTEVIGKPIPYKGE